MADVALSISNLRVDYPGVLAVDGLDLTIHKGDAVALVGPNGAGKTTTMKAIAGIIPKTLGEIKLCGIDQSLDPQRFWERLGYMPDFSPLYENLMVAEYLDHFARAFKIDKPKARIDEVLALTRLGEKSGALCKGLSRGMRQRLIIAKTILPDPDVLIFDEPASGLDPIGRNDLKNLILRLREAGKAVLVSSHILAELSAFCNQVAIMERGALKFAGPVSDLSGQINRRGWLLRWRHPVENVAQLLAAIEGVENIAIKPNEATFEFVGKLDHLDDALIRLVHAGLRVSEWRPLADDLETIFMASGAQEVS